MTKHAKHHSIASAEPVVTYWAPHRVIERPAWKTLVAHHEKVRELHLRRLFADDPGRGERLTAEAVGVFLDYSKNRITDETLTLLLQLAEQSGLRARIDAMFQGDKINVSEKRAVLHGRGSARAWEGTSDRSPGTSSPSRRTRPKSRSSASTRRTCSGSGTGSAGATRWAPRSGSRPCSPSAPGTFVRCSTASTKWTSTSRSRRSSG